MDPALLRAHLEQAQRFKHPIRSLTGAAGYCQ